MAKLKLTKGALKKERDALKMYLRYLPTLQLKKQQLQAEIRSVESRREDLGARLNDLEAAARPWVAVFAEAESLGLGRGRFPLRVADVRTGQGNIAGVGIPVFEGADFESPPYDIFLTPPWVDRAVDGLRAVASLDLEIRVLDEQARLLREELRTTSQRVNLFEKIKIPQAEGNIRTIRVYLGDQETAAVVRGKIAKGKSEGAA